MVGRSRRKVVKNSTGAYLITLPKEWGEQLPDNVVHVVYDDLLWVFPSDREADVDKIMEKLIEKVAGIKITE